MMDGYAKFPHAISIAISTTPWLHRAYIFSPSMPIQHLTTGPHAVLI